MCILYTYSQRSTKYEFKDNDLILIRLLIHIIKLQLSITLFNDNTFDRFRRAK